MGIDLGRFKSKNSEEWDDWLSDDPIPATFRQRIRMSPRPRPPQNPVNTTIRRLGQQPISRPVINSGITPRPVAAPQASKSQKPGEKTVNIRISMPSFDIKKIKLPKQLPKELPKLPKNLTYKQVGIGGGALLLVLVVGGIALNARDAKKPGSTGVLSSSDQHANFPYSLPSGAGHDVAPEEVRYDSNRKVVNYTDRIGGIDITISQQQLPDDFKQDTDNKVKKLAENFAATKVLSTASPTAYLGTSVKGPQTVIFTKKNLLVFIQSTKEIDDHDWAEYITNLK